MRARVAARGGLALWFSVIGLALLGFNETRVGGWTVSDLLFLVSAGIVAGKLLSGRTADLAPSSMRKSSPPVLVGTLVIVIAGMLSSFRSFDPMASVMMVVRLVWITFVWFWVLRAVSPNRRTLHRLFAGFRITLIASCLGAIAGYLGLVSLTPENPENREAAFFGHPNELGGLIAMALPFVVLGVLQGTPDEPVKPWRRVVLIFLAVFALGTSGSMTSFLSAASAGAAIVAAQAVASRRAGRRARSPLPYMLAMGVLGAGLIWLSTTDLPAVERFTEFNEGEESVNSSVSSRGSVNSYVINNLDDSLVLGVGLDASTAFVETGSSVTVGSVHNLYLKLLYETGVPGLLGLLIVVGAAFRQSWRLVLNTRRDPLYSTAVALLGSLTSVTVFALFQPLFAQRYYWLPIGLIGVLWALRRQESLEATTAATGVGASADERP